MAKNRRRRLWMAPYLNSCQYPLINYLNSDYALQCSSSNSSAEFYNIGFSPSKSFWSVGLLLTGIIMARFGLWVSDLTINQQLQENVKEEHRKYLIIFDHSVQIISKVIYPKYSKHWPFLFQGGVIGGVQNAINSAVDTIKFFLGWAHHMFFRFLNL